MSLEDAIEGDRMAARVIGDIAGAGKGCCCVRHSCGQQQEKEDLIWHRQDVHIIQKAM